MWNLSTPNSDYVEPPPNWKWLLYFLLAFAIILLIILLGGSYGFWI